MKTYTILKTCFACAVRCDTTARHFSRVKSDRSRTKQTLHTRRLSPCTAASNYHDVTNILVSDLRSPTDVYKANCVFWVLQVAVKFSIFKQIEFFFHQNTSLTEYYLYAKYRILRYGHFKSFWSKKKTDSSQSSIDALFMFSSKQPHVSWLLP